MKPSQNLARFVGRQLRKPSGAFARLIGWVMNRSNDALYAHTFSEIAFKDGDRVLEIGFGNGRHFDQLKSKAKDLKIHGIDHSIDMVIEARKRNPLLCDRRELILTLGSSESLPYLNDSFDLVFCVNVLYFWDDPEKNLAEIRRVLRPKGRFYASIKSMERLRKKTYVQTGFNLKTKVEWEELTRKSGFSIEKIEAQKAGRPRSGSASNSTNFQCIVAVK